MWGFIAYIIRPIVPTNPFLQIQTTTLFNSICHQFSPSSTPSETDKTTHNTTSRWTFFKDNTSYFRSNLSCTTLPPGFQFCDHARRCQTKRLRPLAFQFSFVQYHLPPIVSRRFFSLGRCSCLTFLQIKELSLLRCLALTNLSRKRDTMENTSRQRRWMRIWTTASMQALEFFRP